MSEIDNNIDFLELENFFVNLEFQLNNYSNDIKEHFKVFRILSITYNKQLNNILILNRKIELIDFFLNIEQQLIYINNVFKNINDKNIKKYLNNQIKNFRNHNANNIKKYLN